MNFNHILKGNFHRFFFSFPLFYLFVGLSLPPRVYGQDNGNPTFFTGQPPVFVGVHTPDSTIAWPNAHYYFTFTLPPNAGESIGQVTIQQQQSPEMIALNVANTYAFIGTQGNKGQGLTTQASSLSQGTGVNVIFNPPVPPGTTFTVRLEAFRNPGLDTTYLYNVTVFPSGSNPTAFPIGVGQLSFYRLF
ncbi:DUF2808 domain-containing protein [Geminocystis sp. GBBB08]|uniref:DUF2808 domain-containing protein n=1 Tax=Geminocystis sp. GBBB08 TaxID=2604140 RepID=UPI0027E2371D|nr:DUF2808 domain-containing protein [Geminocystis sp. GBBB08]MBL1209742.1 DUF2808 domain-containing protein [Geminocystis sp. GBBB08]